MTTETQTQDNMTQTMVWLGAALVAVIVLAWFFAL
jgi:hypothetical protein